MGGCFRNLIILLESRMPRDHGMEPRKRGGEITELIYVKT